MGQIVTLADGTKAEVTSANWNELAARQIAAKEAGGDKLNLQQQSATLDAFKSLAGIGNGFFTVNSSGAAAPRSMGEAEVLNMGTVRLADRISGNPVVGGSVWGDIGSAGAELGRNAADQFDAAAGTAKRAALATVYGFADWWDDLWKGAKNAAGGGLGTLQTVAIAAAVVAVAYAYTTLKN
jgi:hypothetical protein